MNYEIVIEKKARKFILKQELRTREHILKAIYLLPHHGDVRKMEGTKNTYRLRVGSFRALYQLSPLTNTLTLIDVVDADNRGQFYK